jgi:hypothetical protein
VFNEVQEGLQTRFKVQVRVFFKRWSATVLHQVKQGYKSYKPPLRRTYRICRQDFVPTICSTRENKESLLTSYIRGQLLTCPQPRIPFFWFTSSEFQKQPVLFEVLAPASFFLQGGHCKGSNRKRTTLRSKSSTSKGLHYAPDPDNREKGMLSYQP